MKNPVVLLFIATLTSLTALAYLPVNDKLIEGFKTGNAETISRFFNETIELNVPEIEGLHSKDQANFILKDFFRNHIPTGFTVKHKGDSKNGSHYSIGELTTKKGVFRVYLLYTNEGEKMNITELRIEADN